MLEKKWLMVWRSTGWLCQLPACSPNFTRALPTSRMLSQFSACSPNFPRALPTSRVLFQLPAACMHAVQKLDRIQCSAINEIIALLSTNQNPINSIMYIKQLSNFPLISVTFLSLQASTFVRALWYMSHRASKTRYVTAAMNGFVDTVLVIFHFAKRTTRTFCPFFFFSFTYLLFRILAVLQQKHIDQYKVYVRRGLSRISPDVSLRWRSS